MPLVSYKLCYYTLPSMSAFYFDGGNTTTAISTLFSGQEGKAEIFDLSGKRLSHLQKGLNIVNSQKVLVK